MVSSSTFALAALAAASSAMAHMELSWPYAFKSKFNPANTGANIDYSMTSPLAGNQYPCKGYQDASAPSVVTWAAGSTVNYTVAGTATHGGGSCQLSMSYDNGQNWNVIQSIIGGCLIEGLTQEVVIPSEAPSGEALFAWGWFNLVGNREMYHNCAPVTITGGGSGLNSNDYPAPFVANVDAAPGCKTIEGTEVVFPNPGKNVRYGGKYAGTTPQAGAGITGDCGSVTVSPSNTQNSSSSSSAAPAASSASASSAASSAAASASASVIGNQNHAAIPSAEASAATANCKRRSRRSVAERQGHAQANERLVRRKKMH